PQHDAAEVILLNVVAQPEHHRVVDGVEPGGLAPRRITDAPEARARPFPACHRERFTPEGQELRERAVGIDDERTAVEHELILPAHLVDVSEGDTAFTGASARELE